MARGESPGRGGSSTSSPRSRLRLVASTLGACLTLTFAAHAVEAAPLGTRPKAVAQLPVADATEAPAVAPRERDAPA